MFLWGLQSFWLMVALDYAWGRYTQALTARRASSAATWSVFLFLVGATVTQGYLENQWTLIPAAVGAWVGTWLSARRSNGEAE